MNMVSKVAQMVDASVPVRFKLAALWVALMILYIYADILSLYKPGQMEQVLTGRMGPLPVTQQSLLSAALLMLVPAVMVFLSLALRPRAARWASIVLGGLYTAVNVGNLVGETWAFYWLLGLAELALTLLIVGHAWIWRCLDTSHSG